MEDKKIEKSLFTIPISEDNLRIGKEYNKVALEGLLKFLEALYEDLIHDIEKEGLSPIEAIKSELEEIQKLKKAWL